MWTKRCWLIIPLLVTGDWCLAAGTTLGRTAAYQCFEESRMVLSSQGITYCDDAISDSELLANRDLAATYSNRGIIYAGNGKYDRAIKDHSRAIQIKPNLGQAYVNRGNVYYRTHEYEKAIADYDQALEIGGSRTSITYLNRGLALLKMNEIEKAIESLNKALEINPDSHRIKKILASAKEL